MIPLKERKKKLYEYCMQQVKKRIETAQEAIHAIQMVANEETKSSAGDKYETGRAMMELEKEKFAHQLSNALQLKKTMDQVVPERKQESVNLGSLVKTSNGTFYIAVSLGQITIDEISCFVISTASPIGKACMTLKAGDSFSFNGKKYKIEEVV